MVLFLLALARCSQRGFFLLSLSHRGHRDFFRSIMARRSHSYFRPIGAGLLLAALVRFKTIGAGPSLTASFRIGRCRPVVGGVGLINCFPARW